METVYEHPTSILSLTHGEEAQTFNVPFSYTYYCTYYFSQFCWQIFVSVSRQICNLWKMCHELLQCTVLLCRKDWNTCTEMLYIFYRPGKVRGIQGTAHYSDTSCSLINCKWEHLNKQQQFKKNKNKSRVLVRKNTKIVLSKSWDFIIVNRICWLQAQVFLLLKLTVSNDALLKAYLHLQTFCWMLSVYWFYHLFGHSDLHRYVHYTDVKVVYIWIHFFIIRIFQCKTEGNYVRYPTPRHTDFMRNCSTHNGCQVFLVELCSLLANTIMHNLLHFTNHVPQSRAWIY